MHPFRLFEKFNAKVYPNNKRATLYKILTSLTKFFRKKRNIIFYAPYPFHAAHLMPVVDRLKSRSDIGLFLIGAFDRVSEHSGIRVYPDVFAIPLYEPISAYVSTEFGKEPWWLDSPRVFFGHGVGPKLNYAEHVKLQAYDYSFAACTPVYDVHSANAKGLKVEKIGLPMLDHLVVDSESIIRQFGFESERKTIVYAPSWCSDPRFIAPLDEAIRFLGSVADANVVVSPHPNLFLPERCGGNDYFGDFPERMKLNRSDSGISTLELCAFSDIVISDISSVLFESMSMGVTTVFDGNRSIYEYSKAGYLLKEIERACHTITWSDADLFTLHALTTANTKAGEQERFINSYMFNRGRATEAFIVKLEQIVNDR